jgi:diguanylate cyclase (GGDEF)-like protein
MVNASQEHVELLQENARLKEACVRSWGVSNIYAHVAYALARAYTDLFYVNMESGEFIEYHSDDECGMLVESREGDGFFESCRREARLYVHPEDHDGFIRAMNREFLEDALVRSDEFAMTYRRFKDGRTFYVQMKVSRMRDDERFIVVAVSDIDELVMKRRAEERIREERIVYARLHAITGNFIAVYVVEPDTGHYRQFSSTETIERLFPLQKEGEDFFGRSREVSSVLAFPADLGRFLATFTQKNVEAAIERDGIFTLGYRLMIDGRPHHVQIKAAMVEEDKGPRLIIGLNDIDVQVRQEEETERRIARARELASVDALTGVKNKHAYMEAEELLDREIEQRVAPPFAVVVFDVNDLKRVNDTEGHQAGDDYLRDACKVICEVFKHSPVFRVGGDEFVVISQGVDLAHIEERVRDVAMRNDEALRDGTVVLACGVAIYQGDDSVAAVFERADHDMYESKGALKEREGTQAGMRS